MLTNLALPYGLSLALLSWIALRLGRRSPPLLPWSCLSVFAFLAALGVWSAAWGNGYGFPGRAIAAAATAGAGLALLEFARRTHNVLGKRRYPAWIDLPLLCLGALGVMSSEWNGLSAGCRYALVLPSGLWAACLLWRASRTNEPSGRELRVAAASLGILTLSFGIIVPVASLPPASWMNQAVFSASAGISSQSVEALAVLAAAVSLWWHGMRLTATTPTARFRAWWPVAGAILLALAVVWAAAHDDGTGRDSALAGEGQALALVAEQEMAAEDPADWSRLTSQRWRAGIPVLLGILGLVAALVVAGALTNDRPRSKSSLSG